MGLKKFPWLKVGDRRGLLRSVRSGSGPKLSLLARVVPDLQQGEKRARAKNKGNTLP